MIIRIHIYLVGVDCGYCLYMTLLLMIYLRQNKTFDIHVIVNIIAIFGIEVK